MRANRYLNVVLTVIAIELGWIGLAHIGTPVAAQQTAMPVIITGVQMPQADMLPVVLRRADVPIRIDASQPLRIQEPVTVRIPVTSSPEFAK